MERAVSPAKGGSLLRIAVTPGARRDGITGYDGWRRAMKVSVTERAQGGRANAAVETLLGDCLGADVAIVSGRTGRQKVVAVALSPEELLRRLRSLQSIIE